MGFSLDDDVIKKLDETRGLTSRSTLVNDILKKCLTGDKKQA